MIKNSIPRGGFFFLLLLLFVFPHYLAAWENHPAVPGLFKQEFSPEEGQLIEAIREEAWTADGLSYIREIRYSIQGQIESEDFFNPDGSPGSRILYFYDSAGRLEKREFHHPNARLADNETYVWDETRPERLVSVSRLYTSGAYGWRFEYIYDDSGRLVRVDKIDRYWNRRVFVKTLFYDVQGRIAAAESLGEDPRIAWRDEFLYNTLGGIREKTRRDAAGEPVSRTVYVRDPRRGDVTAESEYNGTGQKYAEILYYYRYDAKGNWTEKYLGTGRPGTESFTPTGWYLREYVYRES